MHVCVDDLHALGTVWVSSWRGFALLKLAETGAEAKASWAAGPTASGGAPVPQGVHKQIYPGGKKTHFRAIHQDTGIDYSEYLFFDNERWNCTVGCRPGRGWRR